jgi:thioredoxin 1
MKNTVELTDANFTQEVLEEEVPVLVDFWAEWCGPCRIVGPIVDKLAEQYAGKVKVGKLNVDSNPKSATDYRVTGIPTLHLFKGGKVVDTVVGAVPEQHLVKMLDKHMPSDS